MRVVTVHELIPILQVAIGPVILISGIGLLLLAMTNRFARLADRSRTLSRELREDPEAHRERIFAQVQVLMRRAQLVRRAITLATFSVLAAAVLIIVLFVTALFGLEIAWLITLLFSGCLISLVAALIAFMQDVNLSLTALKRELTDIPTDIH